MSRQRARAFTLRSYNYGEADRVVLFFTEELGLLRGIAKGSRKLRSRIAGALEPLTLVKLMFVEKAGRELAVVTGCEAVRSLFAATTNVELAGVAGVIVELTAEFHPDRDPNPAQFRLLELVQKALLAGVEPKLVMRYTELFTLKLAGILPPPEALRHEGARGLMSALLRTNLLEYSLPEAEAGDLEELGRFLRKRVTEALGKRLKAYRFLDGLESPQQAT